MKNKNKKPKFIETSFVERHRVIIKNAYLLSKDDKDFISDTCRSIVYRKSGHGYAGCRGMSDKVICNRFGFSMYVDSKNIRDRIYLLLEKRFAHLHPVKVVKGRHSKIDRNHRDVYRLVA